MFDTLLTHHPGGEPLDRLVVNLLVSQTLIHDDIRLQHWFQTERNARFAL
jgi:hypothetical protein